MLKILFIVIGLDFLGRRVVNIEIRKIIKVLYDNETRKT